MAHALALIAATPRRLAHLDVLPDALRVAIVCGCALALILADKALPTF